jgi:hypothetical protein
MEARTEETHVTDDPALEAKKAEILDAAIKHGEAEVRALERRRQKGPKLYPATPGKDVAVGDRMVGTWKGRIYEARVERVVYANGTGVRSSLTDAPTGYVCSEPKLMGKLSSGPNRHARRRAAKQKG